MAVRVGPVSGLPVMRTTAGAMTVKKIGPVIGARSPRPFHFAATYQRQSGPREPPRRCNSARAYSMTAIPSFSSSRMPVRTLPEASWRAMP
jgi:hypothetical protein